MSGDARPVAGFATIVPHRPEPHELVDEVCRRASAVDGDVREVVAAEVDRLAPLATADERSRAIARAVSRLDGLDVLDELLRDPAVDEVMVNRGREVWVERSGRLVTVGELDTGTIDTVLERVLAPLGKRLDRSNPIVDARLPDGARLCAVVEPVAVDGTTVSIRRHRRRRFELGHFAPADVTGLLTEIVRARANVLVSGATSSGKTSLLAALAATVDPDERLVVIEDTTELPLDGRHAVRLETRQATADGVGAVEPTGLVRAALRLRPDRLVVGEFRGPEVLAVVQALNTGHDGSLSTCHANGAIDALRRVETLVMQAAPTWPLPAIRRHVSRSLDVVVHVERHAGGDRRVGDIVEIVESGDEPRGRPLVDGGRVVGHLGRRRA